MEFEFSLWNGFSNSKRIVEEDTYDSAVRRYASNLPPAYIWSLVPIKGANKMIISTVEVIESHLYERMAEDGAIHCYDLFVRVVCDGAVYDHKHLFEGAFKDEHEGYYHVNYNAKAEAHRLADRVADAGCIDTDHWNAVGHVDELFKSQEERLEESWSDYSDHFEINR